MSVSPHRIPPEPSWRKPVGMLGIVLYIAAYALAIAALSGWLQGLPRLVEMLVYAVAGLAWIAPLKPVLLWMNTGRWRVK
ncbi:MAG: DUF2842 domain-containing protein [Alphaproteobacteria bacterium]|nr:DUF2842 domain-containing protein [Alphaproteobacteria bacterium]